MLKLMGKKIFYNFTFNIFVYLNLCYEDVDKNVPQAPLDKSAWVFKACFRVYLN